MSLRTIILSHELFQGFTITSSLHEFSSIKELADYIKQQLVAHLTILNLPNLVVIANNMKLHHHDFMFIDELKKSQSDIIYMCSHC